MISSHFKTICYGKWIFSGEHSVLRGGQALVFPLTSRSFNFEYTPSLEPLSIKTDGIFSSEIQLIFPGLLQKAFELVSKKNLILQGLIRIKNDIPLGAGLGASACLCVAIARWLDSMGALEKINVTDLAQQLENVFHGESSGVDVAVAHSARPLIYSRSNNLEFLESKIKPYLYLSYCGSKGLTKECVEKVQMLMKKEPEKFKQIDSEMKAHTINAIQVFKESTELSNAGLLALGDCIKGASQCFRDWGLYTTEMEKIESRLSQEGAVAVKPTGSGGGGFMLSLWTTIPDVRKLDLIPCFQDTPYFI